MKIILTERQYRIISEQTDNVDWLINWFKKVPEKKLIQTFTAKDGKGLNKTLSRNEILNLLSDKSKIVVINDPKTAKRLGVGLAQFRIYNNNNNTPEDKKYLGKVLINGDWKNIIKNDPMYKDITGIDMSKHHEQTHLLQYQQRDNKKEQWLGSGSKIISGFCKVNPNSFCKNELAFGMGYYQRTEEIYAHLFSMRELLGIEPLDTVVDANVTIKNTTATINVSVNRNGKTIKLPTKTMSTESSTFIALYCCNKSFKQTLMYLHNTLAKNDNPNNSELDKMV
jgi:hypothetical protein